MSRGDRTPVSGNLSTSMRHNYSEHGVSEYYTKVGSTYRNPHFPGVRLCLFMWLNKWWQMECDTKNHDKLLIFDMACGSGEVTLACLEWQQIGKKLYRSVVDHNDDRQGELATLPKHKKQITPIALGSDIPQLQIIAADPFTWAAYHDRTSLRCSPLSFKDISEGAFPPLTFSEPSAMERSTLRGDSETENLSESKLPVEMVICSFALHLVESPSELFSLLWELSLKSRWLVVLAPHKRPEIKEGWGWFKWNIDTWEPSRMYDNNGELLHDRPVAWTPTENSALNDCSFLGYIVAYTEVRTFREWNFVGSLHNYW